MCRLSIIIPLLGDPQAFEDTLVSVLQNRPAGTEVLVAHPGRYEDPYGLSDEVVFVQVGSTAGVIGSLNAGMQAARGEIVHLLQPGILADEGWVDAALRQFHEPAIAAVAPLVLDARDRNRIVAAGLRFSIGGRRIVHGAGVRGGSVHRVTRKAIVGPARMAAFYRRETVLALDGLCPRAGDEYADIDLALSLRRLGFGCALEPESVLTALDVEFDAPCNFATGRYSERVFWRHRKELKTAWSLPAHTAQIMGSVLARPHRVAAYTCLIGRLLAAFDRSDYRDFGRRMQRASEACHHSSQLSHDDEEDEQSVLPWPVPTRRWVA